MKSIHDLEDSFSDKSLGLSINRPCFLQEMYVFAPILIILIQGVYLRKPIRSNCVEKKS